MKTLVCGPIVSEFGWEVAACQGHIRAAAAGYDRVVVCSRSDREPLYVGMPAPLLFVGHVLAGQSSAHSAKGIPAAAYSAAKQRLDKIVESFAKEGSVSRFSISARVLLAEQKVIAYGSKPVFVYDVIIHARCRTGKNRKCDSHNWPLALWDKVVAHLSKANLSVAAIGDPAGSLCPAGVIDLRAAGLQHQMNVLSACKLAVGTSSGPMVLASFCRAKHLVWCASRHVVPVYGTGERRFKETWNPFNTSCTAVWCPHVPTYESVVKKIQEVL